MAVYKTKIFNKKNDKKIHLSGSELIKAAHEVMAGSYEANLGGGVIKKRIPLLGKGKSGGARTIIFFKVGKHLFFADGWAKSDLSSKGAKEIEDDVLASYKDLAKDLLDFNDTQINKMIELSLLVEVKDDQ
ncbi:type II toxin-antitoxin system RelE/ParE family toxin [Photorhabdus sp. CRCIA-P01]|uniref:type II toxin-antitoxin system RelE/ParE family toxin n=1 Tax=Photorhabdus sp. CRCIA-P01 TaxID=2019570 RepID=UPI000E59D61D|nr:type II toxin-antitoxin system RelE/ParE family toxin [Photorhabdus sp. CRCIA-P01]